MASVQPKIEKKTMDEKIAKVREVVKNVSTNDIVLALHNFELDIERTIHAFCEGGSEIALGDWERTTAGKKRNHKKKTKTANLLVPPSSGNTTISKEASGATTPSVASTMTYSNGYSDNFSAKSSMPVRFNTAAVAVDLNGLNGRGSPLFMDQPQLVPTKAPVVASAAVNHHSQAIVDGNASTTYKSDLTDNAFGLVDYQSLLEQNKGMFKQEVTSAQENIYLCFKELRDLLEIREQQLLAELARCRKDGHLYFESRKVTLQSLLGESGQVKNSAFMSKLEKFNAEKTEDLEVALTARFFYDKSSIVSAIPQFGKVVPVKLNEAILGINKEKNQSNGQRVEKPPKRAQSPSSLVSSIDEDSGLGGQISPVNHDKGQVVQVEGNGIVLKSDSVSADQLAEIQRQINESLKAKGIDPSILASMGSTVPRRRPPPNVPSKNGTSGGEGKPGKTGGGQGRKNPPRPREQQNGAEKRK